MFEELTFEEILPFWRQLWAQRRSAIEPMSCMTLNREYSLETSNPYYYGFKLNDRIVGVNSIHDILNTSRSRGLYVLPEFRHQGIGEKLIRHGIERATFPTLWSFPKEEALAVYLKCGYSNYSDWIHDPTEKKLNRYVILNKNP